MMTFTDMQSAIGTMVDTFAASVLRDMQANNSRRFGYFLPSTAITMGRLISLSETDDVPDGYEIIDPAPIPAASKADIVLWAMQRVRRLPIMAWQ